VAWFGVVRLIVIVASVLGVGAGAYWLLRAPATPVENTLPYARSSSTTTIAAGGASASPSPSTTASSASASSVSRQPLVVDVAGAVSKPGVYTLQGPARVDDAVAAAGGFAADADLDALNLAAFIADGDRVFVPRLGQPVPSVVAPAGGSGGAGGEPLDSQPVNINRASVEDLDRLPGIGPSTAAAIVAHREQVGPYASVDDLLDVRGIGPAKLDAIRALVTV